MELKKSLNALMKLALVAGISFSISSLSQADAKKAVAVKSLNSKQGQLMGQMNSGGANLLNGLMIEDYIKAPQFDLRAYDEIDLVLTKIARINPCYADAIRSEIEKLTWYFIPTELKEVSQSITGLPFSSDQLAIPVLDNGINEIWVDANKYEALGDLKQQAKLLAHEAFIGLGTPEYVRPKNRVKTAKWATAFARKNTGLIFSGHVEHLTKKELTEKLQSIGWDVRGLSVCERKGE